MTDQRRDAPPQPMTEKPDWFWPISGPLVNMPPCATCGAPPIGTFRDGSPRYALSCSHDPIYPDKKEQP